MERLNQTLQPQLPIELRLEGGTAIAAANEFPNSYLKEFNATLSLPLNGIKYVFEMQLSNGKINLPPAVLGERIVDCGHSIQFQKQRYRLLDSNVFPVRFLQGAKAMSIKAFDGQLFCCDNAKDSYTTEAILERAQKSKELDTGYLQPIPQKRYIPSMTHPWKQASCHQSVRSQQRCDGAACPGSPLP